MKKIIPLVFVAIAAVFLLAGCDQMLEGIYPSQTGGHNNIEITVYAHWLWGGGSIYVELYKLDGTFVDALSFWPPYYSAPYYYDTVSFSGLKDDTYYLRAYSGGSGWAYSSSFTVAGAQTVSGNITF